MFSRNALIKFYLAITILFLFSFLRSALFILSPLFILFYLVIFNSKYSKYIVVLILAVLLSTLVGAIYLAEVHAGNFVLSTYIMLPLTVLFFSRSNVMIDLSDESYFAYFMRMTSYFLLLSNCIGFVQLILDPGSDDAFVGLYGTHGLGVHTLGMVNFMMSSHHFFKYRRSNSGRSLLLSLFFLLSGIVSFYGLGLLVFVTSIILFNLSFRSLIKSVLISAIVVVLLGYALYLIKPVTFNYTYDNLKIARSYLQEDVDVREINRIPRKLVLYKNYFFLYCKDPTLFLFGSGPGTFNSRSSFLLNNDYSKSKVFENVLGVSRPHYAVIGAYSLWNSEIADAKIFLDGTRNQPFSSIVAMLSEYGFIYVALLAIFIAFRRNVLDNRFNDYLEKFGGEKGKETLSAHYQYLKYISLFIFLSLFTDNYLEYPEIILFYLFCYKLIELEINNSLNGLRET